MRVTGSARGQGFVPVMCPRVRFCARVHARGRKLLPISLPVESGIHRYPRLWVELLSLILRASSTTFSFDFLFVSPYTFHSNIDISLQHTLIWCVECESWILLLGIQKSDGDPEHKSHEQERTSHEERGDKESPKANAHLKSYESLYTCPRAPFYRKTKGLLHSENTLESREYS
jgi:hypothetical protein